MPSCTPRPARGSVWWRYPHEKPPATAHPVRVPCYAHVAITAPTVPDAGSEVTGIPWVRSTSPNVPSPDAAPSHAAAKIDFLVSARWHMNRSAGPATKPGPPPGGPATNGSAIRYHTKYETNIKDLSANKRRRGVRRRPHLR